MYVKLCVRNSERYCVLYFAEILDGS